MTRPGKIPSQAGFELRTFRFRGGRLNHLANGAVDAENEDSAEHGLRSLLVLVFSLIGADNEYGECNW